MYIQTDNSNKIIQLISVGAMPTENGYEIDENSVDKEILDDIFSYKYINGEFIKNDDHIQAKLEEVKAAKISTLSDICNKTITSGIDYNGEHFSLTNDDQINLMKLESTAKENPDSPIFYHADGKTCRLFSSDDIKAIAGLAAKWILLNTSYFNLMKSQIKSATSVEEIKEIKYGTALNPIFQATLSMISQNTSGLEIPTVEDDFDYSVFYHKPDIDRLIKDKKSVEKNESEEFMDDPIETEEENTEENEITNGTTNANENENNVSEGEVVEDVENNT